MSSLEPQSPDDLGIPQARPIPAGEAGATPISLPAYFPAPPRDPFDLGKHRPGDVWLDLGVFLGSLILIDLLVVILLKAAFDYGGGSDDRMANVAGMLVRGVVWVGLVVMMVLLRGLSLASVGLTGRGLVVNVPLGLPVACTAFAVFFASVLGLILLFPKVREEMSGNIEEITRMLPRLSPAGIIALQVAVGFYEELVFRGFLLTRLRRVLRSWALAVLVSSVLFAVPHLASQKAVAAIPIFGLGVVFSLFVIWRRSLVPAMVGHAIFNSAQLLYIYYTAPEWS